MYRCSVCPLSVVVLTPPTDGMDAALASQESVPPAMDDVSLHRCPDWERPRSRAVRRNDKMKQQEVDGRLVMGKEVRNTREHREAIKNKPQHIRRVWFGEKFIEKKN